MLYLVGYCILQLIWPLAFNITEDMYMYVFYIINYNVNIIIFLFKLYPFNVIANTRLSNIDLGPPSLLLYLSADMALDI